MRTSVAILLTMLLAFAANSAAAGELPAADATGWHTWTVDSAAAGFDACCFTMKRAAAVRQDCDLDRDNGSYSNGGDCSAAPGDMQIYALMKNGRPEEIRTFSSNCAVRASGPITDLGADSVESSIAWLRKIIFSDGGREVRDDAIFVVSQIPRDQGIQTLVDVVRAKQLDMDSREAAMFWLVQSESDTAFDFFDRVLALH